MTYLATVLADSPVHFWRCADPGGLLYHDLGSAPRSMQNGLSTATSLPYLGPNSDGGSTFLSLNTNANYYPGDQTLATPFTMEVWAWLQKGGTLQGFFAVSNNVNTMEVGVDGSNNAHFYDAVGANTTATAVSLQHWHQYVLVQQAASSTFYFDGAFVANGGGVALSGLFAFMIGAGGYGASPARFANAAVAEVSIYPSALSAARVLAHYNAADQLAQRPIYRGSGEFSVVTGVVTDNTSQLNSVLANITSTYLNSP